MTSQTLKLDLVPSGVAPIIHVSQYDKGQTWNFIIYKEGQPFDIPEGSIVTIQGTKQDNTGFANPCTFSGSVVTATETEQMTIFSGNTTCEISISFGESKIGSANFTLQVEKAALADDVEISDTDLPLLRQAIDAAAEALSYVSIAEDYAEDSEAYAKGTRGGEPVGESDPAYHNNSEYYSELAQDTIGMITDNQWDSIEDILT